MLRKKLPKKERELILLENFISNESLGLRVKSIDEGETPDFIVRELNKNISVELTQLIHPKLIEREAFREKLVDKAQMLFKEKYKDELYVLITFANLHNNFKGNEVDKLAKDIFELVESIYLPNKKYEFHISTKDFKMETKLIEWISVSNNRDLENWQSFGAFLVNEIDVNWVKKVIREKEKMIPKYKGQIDEKWLLLVSNFGFKSDTHSFHYLHQEKMESEFDKIYLYKYREKDIVELK